MGAAMFALLGISQMDGPFAVDCDMDLTTGSNTSNWRLSTCLRTIACDWCDDSWTHGNMPHARWKMCRPSYAKIGSTVAQRVVQHGFYAEAFGTPWLVWRRAAGIGTMFSSSGIVRFV